MIPELRVRMLTDRSVNPEGKFVLYWMTAFRRVHYNFSLQRSVEWARELKKPLLILEALRCDYPWASDRFHQFVLDGMIDNAARLDSTGAIYYPYLEPAPGLGKGLLSGLAERACVVVTDDFPCFFLPRMAAAADRMLAVPLELVDSNGLLPLGLAGRKFERAYSFRRYMQKQFSVGFPELPVRHPLKGGVPEATLQALLKRSTLKRWPPTVLADSRAEVAGLPIDRSVGPTGLKGGASRARRALVRFLKGRLDGYADGARVPDLDMTSRLSPYLHYGHISVHEVFDKLMQKEGWSPLQLVAEPRGQREGWWGVSRSAESFLDQILTWRELGFHACRYSRDYHRYGGLPEWARETLSQHTEDERAHLYSAKEMEAGRTRDRLWNATQQQLVQEGRIHTYLRMLWGKKILEWSPSPQTALRRMITLNDKYALDGRDPNSYSGITWILGRYDRAWGPERPIFGKVRYMSSVNTARKLKVKKYLERYSP